MEVKASAKYIRISPRKVRLVVDLVRGQKLPAALNQLQFSPKGASLPVSKLIKSAQANAVNNFELQADNLFVKEIKVDEGPTLKRWMPRAHGRATPLRKRTSHISVVLGELKDSGVKEAKKQKIAEPTKLGQQPKEDEGIKVAAKDALQKAGQAETKDQGQEIVDPRGEGRGQHTKIEGRTKGFSSKVFRRKSG
ncbi:MAG: 50S ribosomal protein L22 [Candidatus Falkowbacteria bacterium GW2011_GWA2_39_24]|uniref:Large ribosomal subunit protein uL22 n=1 Tax=Candidatus Falkowbacteria bacterium GW2011_GWA2_39_24 TaxID=1618634 RepID=A0A0G0NCQ6_9BACT|nr:MAG: 50S ribosomal protein L22 [Candidatus Falkowbacteria bacterium GW2011_GWA2_39_24]